MPSAAQEPVQTAVVPEWALEYINEHLAQGDVTCAGCRDEVSTSWTSLDCYQADKHRLCMSCTRDMLDRHLHSAPDNVCC